MWLSMIFGGGGSSRSAPQKKRSQHTTRTSSRRADPSAVEDGAHRLDDGARSEEIDTEELRKRRVDHYSQSPAERRQRAVAANARAKTSSSLKARSVTSSDKRHTRRNNSSTSRSSTRSRETDRPVTGGDTRTEDYVYGPPPVELDPIVEEGQAEEADQGPGLRYSSRNHRSSKVSSAALPVDDDVHPDDSISQIGVRPPQDRRKSSTHKNVDRRPSLRRSSTTSTRLDRAPREPSRRESTTSSSKRSAKPAPAAPAPAPVSRRHSTTSVPAPQPLVECSACLDKLPSKQVAHLTCKHNMCHDCLRSYFELSVKDPTSMPPKCCEPLPVHYARQLFDRKFEATFTRKLKEFNTKNRLYCPCGYWIKPNHIHNERGKRFAHCPKCRLQVCALCNNKAHKSADCPKDPDIAKIVEQGKKEGWMRCYSCNAMVEKSEGCNHMTCTCSAEFCIKCGAKWKTCDCQWFEGYDNFPDPNQLHAYQMAPQVRALFQDALNIANARQRPPGNAQPERRRGARAQPRTYQQELEERQLQERLDEELARRMQLASVLEPEDGPLRRPGGGDDDWGFGNAARHLLNDDYVQNAANVVMDAFGNPGMGRRGERESGRLRRPRRGDQGRGDPGLPADFLGDASVLGAPPGRRF